MSNSFPTRQIIRCPLCHSPHYPVHIGNSVLVCEQCGNYFRVVMANKGTGKKLQEFVKNTVTWKSGK